MKRFLVLVFALLMTFTALASEQIDIGGMSDEEILALQVVLNDEIEARGLGSSSPTVSSKSESPARAFYPGIYVGGENISPGSYAVSIEFEDNELVNMVYVKQANNKEDIMAYKYTKNDALMEGTDGFTFTIDDGAAIEFSFIGQGIKMYIESITY